MKNRNVLKGLLWFIGGMIVAVAGAMTWSLYKKKKEKKTNLPNTPTPQI